jgi:cobalamin biosynthesis Co2+ chelatase CbiK
MKRYSFLFVFLLLIVSLCNSYAQRVEITVNGVKKTLKAEGIKIKPADKIRILIQSGHPECFKSLSFWKYVSVKGELNKQQAQQQEQRISELSTEQAEIQAEIKGLGENKSLKKLIAPVRHGNTVEYNFSAAVLRPSPRDKLYTLCTMEKGCYENTNIGLFKFYVSY